MRPGTCEEFWRSKGTDSCKNLLGSRLRQDQIAQQGMQWNSETLEGSLQGENAVARYIAVAAEASLYPACPFEEQSRHSAAQVDSWVEFSANEIQRRLQLLFAAPSQEVESWRSACA